MKTIRNKIKLRNALARIDEIIDAKHGTPEYNELQMLSTRVEAFEEKHCAIPPPNPAEAIKFRIDQKSKIGRRQTQDVTMEEAFEGLKSELEEKNQNPQERAGSKFIGRDFLAWHYFEYADALFSHTNNDIVSEYEQVYSSMFSPDFLPDLRKAISDFHNSHYSGFQISQAEALLIIKRMHPRYLEKDRYVKQDEHGLRCDLFQLRIDDGKYSSLSYYIDNPDDPFKGKTPILCPCDGL